jgi:hypothetical protein
MSSVGIMLFPLTVLVRGWCEKLSIRAIGGTTSKHALKYISLRRLLPISPARIAYCRALFLHNSSCRFACNWQGRDVGAQAL